MMFMIPCALASPILFMFLTYWMDHKHPEPFVQLAKATVLGGVVALLSLSFTSILNHTEWLYMGDISTWSHFKQAFFGAALPEEISKLTMLWILLRNNKYFDDFLDGIVYAVFIAMGFAAIENICYALTDVPGWQAVIIGRTILSVPAHFCYAVVMGTYYSFSHFRRQKTFLYLAAIIPVLLHGVFDFCLTEVTPETTGIYLAIIAFVFFALLLLMAVFAFWGIITTRTTDEVIYHAIQQKLWKLSTVRHYLLVGVMLGCTLLLNGEIHSPADISKNNMDLSKELVEFRDAFCLRVREGYTRYAKDKDAQALNNALQMALCEYDESAYSDNQEFSMIKYRVRLLPFSALETIAPESLVEMKEHTDYHPQSIRKIAEAYYQLRLHESDFMYEICHNLKKWATDGSATESRLPVCLYLNRVLKARSEVSFVYECFGEQELLLVSEDGGNLQLELLDKTRNVKHPVKQTDGASWLTWMMRQQGECVIRITNPTNNVLSFTLATLQK